MGLCLLGVTHSLSSKDKKSIPLYKDAKAPIEKRIDDLISRMTLEEKILQLNQYTLGRNNNVNNVGEEVKKVPSEIGSLIYFDINPELRNSMQKKRWKNLVWAFPSFLATMLFMDFAPYILFRWGRPVHGIRDW